MASVNPWVMGAVEFVRVAANRRASTYRERAAQLTELAEAEPIAAIRNQLIELARRYDDLA